MNRNEYTVANKRSGTMTISTEPSDLTMYLSPYLTEFERRFFVDNMEVRSIEFTSGGNAQIFCRCMIHDPSRSAENQMLPSKFPRGSETVLCVHAFNKLTTSWAWIKLATTLFRQGFNVILMDLPGFGRSSVGRNIRCSIEQWRRWDVQIFSAFLAELKIPRVNMIGCYDSASVFLQILLNAPQILSKNHFLHNVCHSFHANVYSPVASVHG
jgi:pimeloyl-ACP methyl ester carboxylesterase